MIWNPQDSPTLLGNEILWKGAALCAALIVLLICFLDCVSLFSAPLAFLGRAAVVPTDPVTLSEAPDSVRWSGSKGQELGGDRERPTPPFCGDPSQQSLCVGPAQPILGQGIFLRRTAYKVIILYVWMYFVTYKGLSRNIFSRWTKYWNIKCWIRVFKV